MNATKTNTVTTEEWIGEYRYLVRDGAYFRGCTRCGGTGHYSFNGFDSVCYLCNNSLDGKLGVHVGSHDEAVKDADRRTRGKVARDRKREEKRLAKLAARDAAWQGLKDAHPAVWDLVSAVRGITIPYSDGQEFVDGNERDTFVLSLADKLWSYDERHYTERQIAALQRVVDKRAAQKAVSEANPAPEGRVVIRGDVVSAKMVEGEYGTSYKIMVKDERGFRVWCSIPKAQADEAFDKFHAWLKENKLSNHDFGYAVWLLGDDNASYPGVIGRRITFAATLKQSDDDKSFAWGSRPSKGEWLS
jgi:hypothetical protein